MHPVTANNHPTTSKAQQIIEKLRRKRGVISSFIPKQERVKHMRKFGRSIKPYAPEERRVSDGHRLVFTDASVRGAASAGAVVIIGEYNVHICIERYSDNYMTQPSSGIAEARAVHMLARKYGALVGTSQTTTIFSDSLRVVEDMQKLLDGEPLARRCECFDPLPSEDPEYYGYCDKCWERVPSPDTRTYRSIVTSATALLKKNMSSLSIAHIKAHTGDTSAIGNTAADYLSKQARVRLQPGETLNFIWTHTRLEDYVSNYESVNAIRPRPY